jgi:predicted amidohydrolase YtcJ
VSAKESGNDKRKSNLNFINVSVYTVDKNRTWAQAVANAGDQIVFVGSNEALNTTWNRRQWPQT